MTKREYMRLAGIHTCWPAYDPDSEADEEFRQDTIELLDALGSKHRADSLREKEAELFGKSEQSEER